MQPSSTPILVEGRCAAATPSSAPPASRHSRLVIIHPIRYRIWCRTAGPGHQGKDLGRARALRRGGGSGLDRGISGVGGRRWPYVAQATRGENLHPLFYWTS